MKASEHDCDRFTGHLNEVLDGIASLDVSDDAEACENCRMQLAAVKSLAQWKPTEPAISADFAERCVALAQQNHVRDRNWHRVLPVAVAALAASVALVIGLTWPKPKVEPTKPQEAVAHVPPATVTKPLAEAREAIASLSSKAVQDSLEPAVNLFSIPAAKAAPVSTSPFNDLPNAAKAGLEPFASSPKRAFNRLVRDVSRVAGTKPNN